MPTNTETEKEIKKAKTEDDGTEEVAEEVPEQKEPDEGTKDDEE